MDDKNNIVKLRDHLFDALDQLKDKENPVDLDRIQMINQTAQVIINSAKVEVDYAKATGTDHHQDFYRTAEQPPSQTADIRTGLDSGTTEIEENNGIE